VSTVSECTPFNGCSSGFVQCSSGDCKLDINECPCANGPKPVGCFDGTCVDDFSQCPQVKK